eukprot:TRINITY_DN322_c0_g1_i1.p1 TRINITY_DN322_c0_g1~~TRINITY_DN322_c0_g1_i1.p1  ORF type:complete len:292 (-),score=105.54 TRINITY_DN322_c0_g1_i1:196-1038(-)
MSSESSASTTQEPIATTVTNAPVAEEHVSVAVNTTTAPQAQETTTTAPVEYQPPQTQADSISSSSSSSSSTSSADVVLSPSSSSAASSSSASSSTATQRQKAGPKTVLGYTITKEMETTFNYVILGVLALSLLFVIIAIAMPKWSEYKTNGVKVTSGLYKYCIDGTCEDIASADVGSDLQAVRVFSFFTLFLLIAVLGYYILVLYFPTVTIDLCACVSEYYQKYISISLLIMTQFWAMLAWAIYADKTDNSNEGASFGLFVSQWVFILVIMPLVWIVQCM